MEVLVIGDGAAGLLAAARLASEGREVTVIGRGTPALALSSACLDIGGELRDFLLPRLREQGHPLEEGDVRAVTDIGTPLHCRQAHPWVAKASGFGEAVMVRVDALPPKGLVDRSVAVREETVHFPSLDPLRGMDDASVEAFAEALSPLGEELLIPPVLGGCPLGEVERRAGARIAEAVVPLSAQGRRLHRAMTGVAEREGARVLRGREAVRVDGGEVEVRSGMRSETWSAETVVLATGGPVTRGLVPRGRDLLSPLAPLDVPPLEGDVLMAGVRTDDEGRPFSAGRPMEGMRCVGEVVWGVRGLSASLGSAWRVMGAMP